MIALVIAGLASVQSVLTDGSETGLLIWLRERFQTKTAKNGWNISESAKQPQLEPFISVDYLSGMLVQNYTKFLNLSKVLNTSFGSTGPNPGRTGTQVIKYEQLSDGLLKVVLITTVNFASDTRMRESRVRWEKDAMSMIEAALKEIASNYKEQFKEEVKLSIVKQSFNDSFEMISYSQYNPMHRALYRVGILVDVE